LIIGSALVPVQIIMVILLLTSEKQGPLKAIAFVVGMTLVRLAQGLLFGLIFVGGSTDVSEGSGWIKSTLLAVLGILLLINAYKSFRKEPDPDAPPPKWLAMIEKASPLVALAMGAGLILLSAKLWVFTLGAISAIGAAQLGQPSSTIAFLLFVLLAESLLIIPILIRLLFPAKASALLGSFGDWLEAHNSQIVMVVSLVFGALFLYQGLTGLFA
jgi:hypothetical protein